MNVRRERPHPGAQLSFTDVDGYRFGAILTDQPGEIAAIERRHRARARVEDHIRNDKDTGLRNLQPTAVLDQHHVCSIVGDTHAIPRARLSATRYRP